MYISFSASLAYIKSDLYRYTGKVTTGLFLKNLVRNPSFKYSFWMRLSRTKNPFIRRVARFMHNRITMRLGIEMPMGLQIGYGLYIGHHRSLIISPTARIGNNCNLSQNTTIGSNHGQAATIGDNVYIGPNVCIVENVVIGDNATIGAGAVVVKDVPAGATVAGNPARVISHKAAGRYIRNKWPLD